MCQRLIAFVGKGGDAGDACFGRVPQAQLLGKSGREYQCKLQHFFGLLRQNLLLILRDFHQCLTVGHFGGAAVSQCIHQRRAKGIRQVGLVAFGYQHQIASIRGQFLHRVLGQCRAGLYQMPLLHHIAGAEGQFALGKELCDLLQIGRMALVKVVKHHHAATFQRTVQILQKQPFLTVGRVEGQVHLHQRAGHTGPLQRFAHFAQRQMPTAAAAAPHQNGAARAVGTVPTGDIGPLECDAQLLEKGLLPGQRIFSLLGCLADGLGHRHPVSRGRGALCSLLLHRL